MDLKKLGNILTAGGVAVLVGAVAWWYSFYSSIMRDVSSVPGARGEISIFDAKSCIYSEQRFLRADIGRRTAAGQDAL